MGLPRVSFRLAVLSLACLGAAVFLGKGDQSTLPSIDTATIGAVSLAVSEPFATESGLARFTPKLPMTSPVIEHVWPNGAYNDYPFAFMLANGWIIRALGPSSYSGRLLSGLFAVACVLLTVALGARLRSRTTGLIAGLILLFTQPFIRDGLNGHLDPAVLCGVLLGYLAWLPRETIAGHAGQEWGAAVRAGAWTGAATWIKSPIALVLVAVEAVEVMRVGWAERWRGLIFQRRVMQWVILSVSALFAASLIWILTAHFGSWALVKDYWVRQVWGTAVGGRGQVVETDYFRFFGILKTRYMPWTLFLVGALVWIVRGRRWREEGIRIPLVTAAILIGFVSCIRFKFDHYYVISYPFLSVLMAMPVADYLKRKNLHERFAQALTAFALVGVTVVLATPLTLVPESFPALKRFMPLISTPTSVADVVSEAGASGGSTAVAHVVVLSENLPYGSGLDYRDLLHFYTGRKAYPVGCADLQKAVQSPSAVWIVADRETLDRCLSPAARAPYTREYRYETMVLLTRRGRSTTTGVNGVDLTPLVNEHHGVH